MSFNIIRENELVIVSFPGYTGSKLLGFIAGLTLPLAIVAICY